MRPGRAHERHVRRPRALARPARARGHGARAQLVRRCRGAALAGRRVPRGPPWAARRTGADRLALALDLLRDPAFDLVVTGESRFDELPGVMARLAAGSLSALCHTITYDGA